MGGSKTTTHDFKKSKHEFAKLATTKLVSVAIKKILEEFSGTGTGKVLLGQSEQFNYLKLEADDNFKI